MARPEFDRSIAQAFALIALTAGRANRNPGDAAEVAQAVAFIEEQLNVIRQLGQLGDLGQ